MTPWTRRRDLEELLRRYRKRQSLKSGRSEPKADDDDVIPLDSPPPELLSSGSSSSSSAPAPVSLCPSRRSHVFPGVKEEPEEEEMDDDVMEFVPEKKAPQTVVLDSSSSEPDSEEGIDSDDPELFPGGKEEEQDVVYVGVEEAEKPRRKVRYSVKKPKKSSCSKRKGPVGVVRSGYVYEGYGKLRRAEHTGSSSSAIESGIKAEDLVQERDEIFRPPKRKLFVTEKEKKEEAKPAKKKLPQSKNIKKEADWDWMEVETKDDGNGTQHVRLGAQTCSDVHDTREEEDDEEEEEEDDEEEEDNEEEEEEEEDDDVIEVENFGGRVDDVIELESFGGGVDGKDEIEMEDVGGRVDENKHKEKATVQPIKRVRKGPLTSTEIHGVLLNSILEEGNTDVVEEPAAKSEEIDHSRASSNSLDSDSEEEMPPPPKDPMQEELDSTWRLAEFCLASCYGSAAAASYLEAKDARNQEQLCRGGEHYLILDYEVGIICKLCGHVREEIRHYLPPFNENPWGFSDRSRYSSYRYHDPQSLPYFEDPNIDSKHSKDDAEFDPTGSVWAIIPDIRKTLYPHQREAFEFIWRNVGGGTELNELKSKRASDGGGCLISHDPGTGKTRLAIAFLETHMKFYKNSRPVILAPASILLTWKKEFNKWKVGVPFLNLNDNELSEQERSIAGSLFGRNYEKNLTNMAKRLIKVLYWKKHESVLAISYTLFTQLAGGEDIKKRGKKNKDAGSTSATCSRLLDEKAKLREMLLEMPGLLILDEGHMPRNEKSQMFDVLSRVKTKKRVLLSGTPFQNNFRELYNLLCLVRKEFVDEENPFKSCRSNDKADEGKIRDFKEKIKPFCHRYDNFIISATVPGLVDNVICLQPSELQSMLLKKEEENKSYLEANANMTQISVHPLLLNYKDVTPDFTEEVKSGSWSIDDSAKLKFLIRLIGLSSILEEKVLVFSQYLDPLNLIKALLMSDKHFGWRDGVEILIMSGDVEMASRQRIMEKFNKSGSKAKVMLASTKACSEGIELTGASRVVLLDVTWNPSVERQAISRAYRMGQRKVVHVYHLIMTNNDNNRHLRQTQKTNFSKYMFPSSNKKISDVPGSSKETDCEDLILERLLEEKIITDATCKKINPSN